MAQLTTVPVTARPVINSQLFDGPGGPDPIWGVAQPLRAFMAGRVIWNVSSTSAVGAQADLLRSFIATARGAGIDARWIRIRGPRDFFFFAKQLCRALRGVPGEYSMLNSTGRRLYDDVSRDNACEFPTVVHPGDVVILHGPQTIGLSPHLVRTGAQVMWRCRIGDSEANEYAEEGWKFLAPYLEAVQTCVFARSGLTPPGYDPTRVEVIPTTIDPHSPKNQRLDPEAIRSILVRAGILGGPPGIVDRHFLRVDGSPGRVDRAADVVRVGSPPPWNTPLIVQVSRWDRLKDPLGVMKGFVNLVLRFGLGDVQLVLAGPNVHAVEDDPEAPAVFNDVIDAWRQLPYGERQRIHLVNLPMTDPEESAAIVNALQRHAAVVVQKSLYEGSGSAVSEAMWKSRPIVATAVPGIRDQIEDEKSGLLLEDPQDLHSFAKALHRILKDPVFGAALGDAAHQRIRQRLEGAPQLHRWCALLEHVAAGGSTAYRASTPSHGADERSDPRSEEEIVRRATQIA
jgi:trehalose synthase